MRKFNAKIKIDYLKKTCRGVIVVVPTYGEDETNARLNVDMLVANWQEIKKYEILKISPQQIYLTQYEVYGVAKFKRKPAKELFFILNAESREEASELFREKIKDWHELVSSEITKIMIH